MNGADAVVGDKEWINIKITKLNKQNNLVLIKLIFDGLFKY